MSNFSGPYRNLFFFGFLFILILNLHECTPTPEIKDLTEPLLNNQRSRSSSVSSHDKLPTAFLSRSQGSGSSIVPEYGPFLTEFLLNNQRSRSSSLSSSDDDSTPFALSNQGSRSPTVPVHRPFPTKPLLNNQRSRSSSISLSDTGLIIETIAQIHEEPRTEHKDLSTTFSREKLSFETPIELENSQIDINRKENEVFNEVNNKDTMKLYPKLKHSDSDSRSSSPIQYDNSNLNPALMYAIRYPHITYPKKKSFFQRLLQKTSEKECAEYTVINSRTKRLDFIDQADSIFETLKYPWLHDELALAEVAYYNTVTLKKTLEEDPLFFWTPTENVAIIPEEEDALLPAGGIVEFGHRIQFSKLRSSDKFPVSDALSDNTDNQQLRLNFETRNLYIRSRLKKDIERLRSNLKHSPDTIGFSQNGTLGDIFAHVEMKRGVTIKYKILNVEDTLLRFIKVIYARRKNLKTDVRLSKKYLYGKCPECLKSETINGLVTIAKVFLAEHFNTRNRGKVLKKKLPELADLDTRATTFLNWFNSKKMKDMTFESFMSGIATDVFVTGKSRLKFIVQRDGTEAHFPVSFRNVLPKFLRQMRTVAFPSNIILTTRNGLVTLEKPSV